MTPQELDARFAKGDALIDSIRDEQLDLLRAAGSNWRPLMDLWADLAKAEASIGREYRGRYLFELLQNANDAVVDYWLEHDSRKVRQAGKRVRFEVTHESLLVANDGMPFNDSNIRAICRLHNTTKSASKQIGHKGIGFKSVLEISDKPEVYSIHPGEDFGFAFGFDHQEFHSVVRRIVKAAQLQDSAHSVLRAPFPRRMKYLSAFEQERVRTLFEKDFVTVVRLPFKDLIHASEVRRRVEKDLTPQLLLFLDTIEEGGIDQIEVWFAPDVAGADGEDIAFWREAQRRAAKADDIRLWSDKGGDAHIESRWLRIQANPLEIRNRALTSELGEAWSEVHAVRCAAAFPLTRDGQLQTDGRSRPFHVYFPTEEPTGLPFLIHADFYIEAARKDIRPGSLNDWLAQELALYLASTGVDALKEVFPHDPGIVDVLAPVAQPDRDFSSYFLEQYHLALFSSAFVPTQTNHYKAPGDIRFPPRYVDSSDFRHFVLPSRFADGTQWAYPSQIVEQHERLRSSSFLLPPDPDRGDASLPAELYATEIEYDEVIDVLYNDGPSVPQSQYARFVRFLANWWDALPPKERSDFAKSLSLCRIVPTREGLQSPKEKRLFQANLREEVDIEIPHGFDVELVPIAAYGEEQSYDGTPARFLTAVGVNPYAERDILRLAILPVLRTPERFQGLLREYPSGVFEAYRYLKRYFERDRSKSELESDLLRVPVPVRSSGETEPSDWLSAGDVYFSKFWTRNYDLESIYGQFDDCFFLSEIKELPELAEESTRQGWRNFFLWLGVSDRPRLQPLTRPHNTEWWLRDLKGRHALRDCARWDDYLSAHEGHFNCEKPNHRQTRRLTNNWALHHFEDLADTGDVALLSQLLQLLAQFWEEYRPYLSVELRCHPTTGCSRERIPSYFGYCLREVAWLPAQRWDAFHPHLFKASDVWNLGDDVRPEVRRTLPSLPDEYRHGRFSQLRSDLLRKEVDIGDYIALMERLPEICPLEPPFLEKEVYPVWQKAVRAVFNWLGQALQNSLVRVGDEHRPMLPEALPVLAFAGERLCYVPVMSQALVYPDDPFLEEEWRDELLYFRVDQNWVALRKWLRIPDLSEKVVLTPVEVSKLPQQSQQVRDRFRAALPYFLAVVHEQQNSRYERVVGLLQRLDIHVVEKLDIRQEVEALPIPARMIARQVYLKVRFDPNPRGGQAIQAGDLYLIHNEVENPDILGTHIANYIEIDRLSDAFVLVYGRRDRSQRLRYLASRGIEASLVSEIAKQLEIPIDDDVLPPDYSLLTKAFREQKVEVPTAGYLPSDGDEVRTPQEPEADGDSSRDIGADEYIAGLVQLDNEGEIKTVTFDGDSTMLPRPRGTREQEGGGDGVRHGRRFATLPEKARDALGRRGEEWAYAAERQRLQGLGLDPDSLEADGRLRWVSKVDDKYAPYDIRSVDKVEDEEITIYIEVKSTTSGDRSVLWPITEFEHARKYGDSYWLYWIGHVDRRRPDAPVRYQNPLKLWQENRLLLDFRQLILTLPSTDGENSSETEDAKS